MAGRTIASEPGHPPGPLTGHGETPFDPSPVRRSVDALPKLQSEAPALHTNTNTNTNTNTTGGRGRRGIGGSVVAPVGHRKAGLVLSVRVAEAEESLLAEVVVGPLGLPRCGPEGRGRCRAEACAAEGLGRSCRARWGGGQVVLAKESCSPRGASPEGPRARSIYPATEYGGSAPLDPAVAAARRPLDPRASAKMRGYRKVMPLSGVRFFWRRSPRERGALDSARQRPRPRCRRRSDVRLRSPGGRPPPDHFVPHQTESAPGAGGTPRSPTGWADSMGLGCPAGVNLPCP